MIQLIPVKEKDKTLFWSINQKYLYEMTLYYPDKMDENGNYHYGYFEQYFVDEKRKAYFIYNDDAIVGFVMINPYSVLNHEPDYTIAEFTIFPSFRGKHLASQAVKLIFDRFKGSWEIKFSDNNLAAKRFWTQITAKYNPTLTHLSEAQTVLEFIVR